MKKLLRPFIFGVSPLFLIAFAAGAYLFKVNPQLDLDFSALFFREGDFILEDNLFGTIVYRGVHIFTGLMVAAFILFIIICIIQKKTVLAGIKRKTVVYLLAVLLLGPGLIVNQALKNGIGRARPANVEQFCGEKLYSPAFTLSNQCENNCSFVSGHASFGFYWVVLGFLGATAMKRRMGLSFGVFMGVGIGLIRVMQGRHYLSDVVFAFFFVYLAAAFLYWLMYTSRPDSCNDRLQED